MGAASGPCGSGFPSHADLWAEDLDQAQAEAAALARALAGPGRERVRLMVRGEALPAARERLGEVAGVEIVPGRFGDIWLRDTAPIFSGPGSAAAFKFNGWGGKYILDHDDDGRRPDRQPRRRGPGPPRPSSSKAARSTTTAKAPA